MKKHVKIVFILMIIFILLLSGCDTFIDSDSTGQKKCEELLSCFDNNDIKGLKEMFCIETLSSGKLDEQIQNAIGFFEGKIISHDSLVGISGGGRSIRDGKTVKLDINPRITNIKTDANKTYEIKFYCYLINTDNTDKEGISEILITSDSGQKCTIGKYIE